MKYLYIVDYWVPFPSSEYGGLINLIAESDTEAFEILSQEQSLDNRYEQSLDNRYTDRIMERIVNSQKFALQDDYQSGILEAFTT